MAGFNPPDYDAPLAVPSGSATELDGVPMNFAPPAAPPAPATEVDGVPVDWDAPLAVPSGGNGVLNPSSYTLTVTAAGDLGDVWTLWTNGAPVQYTVGSGSWVLTILTPGAAGDVWEVHVGAQTASYTVLLGDLAADVAAALDAALEALTGVGSSSVGAAVTFVLDSGANFTPAAETDGAGTFTLSGVAGKDTPTEVAAGLEIAFDAALDLGPDDFAIARAGAALTVTRDVPGYLNARLETDGSGTSTRTLAGTPTNFNPQPVPDATPGTEVDGVPVTWDPPAATPDGGAWVLTES
jgi:hypothetical protein